MNFNLFKRKEKLGEKLLSELEKKEIENKKEYLQPADKPKKEINGNSMIMHASHPKIPLRLLLTRKNKEPEQPAVKKDEPTIEKTSEPIAKEKKPGLFSKLKLAKEKFAAKKKELKTASELAGSKKESFLKEKGKEKTISKADGKDKLETSPLAPKHENKLEQKLKKFSRHKDKWLKLKKKKKFSIGGFAKSISLRDYLVKSGMEDLEPKVVTKKIFRGNILLCVLLSIAIIIYCIMLGKGLATLLVYLLGFWLLGFVMLIGLIWGVYLFYLDMKIFQRTKAVEDVFPDFLQLTSANISAGMPIDKALWYAVRPGFGALAKEIEIVAKNTMAGEDLSTALENFANKYESKVIQRSISLLLEGMAAGGEMADLLSKIALDIDETKIMKKEMSASVTTYVIFITFATIVAAPVLFALATQLLKVIKEITSKLGPNMASSSSFFSFSISSESVKTSDFVLFTYLILIISSISSAAIVSIIRKGRVKEGLSRIPVFILISVIIYTISSLVIGGLFTNFI